MIHWAWLIAATTIGGFIGVVVMALFNISAANEREED